MALAGYVCSGQQLAQLSGHLLTIVYAWVPLAAIIWISLLAALHQGLSASFKRTYASRASSEQLVTCTHCALAAAFVALAIPMTYYTSRLVLGDFLLELGSCFIPAFILFDILLAAYLAEAGARALVRRNLVLVLHHSVFFVITTIGFYRADIFTLKMGLILATFTFYEAPLFATLVLRKLGAPKEAVVISWVAGMALYAATRIVQAVVLGFLFAKAYQPMRGCGLLEMFWADAALAAVIIVLQLHTFFIYYGVLSRSLRQHTAGKNINVEEGACSSSSSSSSCCSSEGKAGKAELAQEVQQQEELDTVELV